MKSELIIDLEAWSWRIYSFFKSWKNNLLFWNLYLSWKLFFRYPYLFQKKMPFISEGHLYSL